MNIVLIQVIYNEIEMLPWKYRWAKENGIKLFTFDNGSTDGSWEWLEKYGKKRAVHLGHDHLETLDIFSLRLNNRAIVKKFHEIKPDWCIVAGCDSFYKVLDYPIQLNRFIEIADDMGYNVIDCSRCFNFYYTGSENDANDPRKEYHYYEEVQGWNVYLIAKYQNDFEIDGDQFKFNNMKLLQHNGFVCLHYWFRSDARERFIRKWQRRYQSWQKNIDIEAHDSHYSKIVMEDRWVRDKEELQYWK